MSRSIPKPLREAVWRKDYSGLDGKCWVCNRNSISIMNFECGHIKSAKRGGLATLDNLKAICGPCNKSMGTKDMLHYRTNLWRGRKQPKKRQADEIKNNIFKLIAKDIPRVVNKAPPVIIKLNKFPNLLKTYKQFESFIRPRARMSDVYPLFENYICCLDRISETPELAKTMNIIQCLEKFSQCKSWYDTASGYERGKYSDLLSQLRTLM